MAQEDDSEMPQQAAASEEGKGTAHQTSSMIEICDSSAEHEEGATPNPAQMEEKSFVSSLYSFMKGRGTPIERIPHLGFKQINLWRIYKAVEKHGGYDSVTARRLWKNVYDELGGSPGSTSAATCTRRHYERLVLPFERHQRGEADKPLPSSKPRKPYRRNLDGKVNKAEGKRKRTLESELHAQRTPEAACQNEAGMHALSPPWAVTSDRHHPDCSQPNKEAGDRCVYACSHLVPVPPSSHWSGHSPSAAGEVISPLEKKKRMAQASLNLPLSPQGDDKERPSVIHCSQSPALASSSPNCNSSEGSPLPASSSSSRSPSPASVSSEDGPAGNEDKPAPSTEKTQNYPSAINTASGCSEGSKPLRCSPMPKVLAGQNKDVPQLLTDSTKSNPKDSAWKPFYKGSGRNSVHPGLPTSPSFSVMSDWIPPHRSSFSKVIPKSVQPLRPAPFAPGYKYHQSRLMSTLTEKREKSGTMQPKPLPTQPSLSHSSASLPVPCILPGYDRSGRDSQHQPSLHPAFIPGRMRLPHSQPLYPHLPMGPAQSAFIGSALYSYPYPFPLWSHHSGYTIPGMNSIYPHKL